MNASILSMAKTHTSVDCTFSEIDKKIRKHWLYATIVSFWIYPLIAFSVAFFQLQATFALHDLYLIYSFIAIMVLIQFYLVYRCAYKKPGYRLLQVVIVLSSCNTFRLNVMTLLDSFDLTSVLYAVLDIGICAWWCIQSYKLIRMNKALKILNSQPPQEYFDSLVSMNESESMAILDIRFSAIMKSWPQFEAASSREYEKKKSSLPSALSSLS